MRKAAKQQGEGRLPIPRGAMRFWVRVGHVHLGRLWKCGAITHLYGRSFCFAYITSSGLSGSGETTESHLNASSRIMSELYSGQKSAPVSFHVCYILALPGAHSISQIDYVWGTRVMWFLRTSPFLSHFPLLPLLCDIFFPVNFLRSRYSFYITASLITVIPERNFSL